mgnify:CR=1 FL=1
MKKSSYFFRVILISFLLSSIYVGTKTNYYESKISLYAAGELEDGGLLSQYSSIADNLGISTMTPSANYYIPDIVDSRSLKEELVNKKWNNLKFSKPKNLVEYWEIDKKGFLTKFISKLKKFIISNKFENKEISNLNSAIENLNELIFVDEQNSGLILVSVNMEEPQLAADIANYISQYVVDFVKKQQKSFADKSRNFIDERLSIAKKDLEESEIKLTNFRKENPLLLDTPELQLSRARFMRDVEVNQEVFITLRKQLEIAKIESNKERLYINVLDKAFPNPSKSKPNRLLLILIFTFLGLFFSIFLEVIRINFKNITKK